MSVSKITKSSGAGAIEAPGVSLATLNYGTQQAATSITDAYTIAPEMMEAPNNPFTAALRGEVPDDSQVRWYFNDVLVETLPYQDSYTPTMAGKITYDVTIGGQTFVSTPLHIYMHDMSDPAMSPTHMADENAVLALVRQDDATAIAVQDGNWTDPATWSTGQVPGDAARVLIPSTREVIYDSVATLRLHSIRVDGVLDWAQDQSTSMLVEHLVETKTGMMRIARKASRLPRQFTATITISNRVVDASPAAPSDLDFAADTRLIGRGVLWMGRGVMYGFHRQHFAKTMPLALPMAGDTSIMLGADPEGWAVGDQIIIPGTFYEDLNGQTQRQDEYRVISGIAGGVVSFDEPLVYNHDWQNPTLTEQESWRLKIVNSERNIVIQSEDGASLPAWQRGHTMVMHTNQTRHWDVKFFELGRTDKQLVTGTIDENGDFFFPNENANGLLTGTLTAQSNLQSRYPYHIHFPGFDKTTVAEAYYLYIEGTPGWALVHHGGRCNMVGCVMHRFAGAGMVSESANELGRWHDCISFGCESTIANIQFPKGGEGKRGIQGDFAFHGYGFFYRGRDMVVTDCTAYGCTWAHVFYHRFFESNVSSPIDPLRQNLDSHDLGWLKYGDRITFVDRPITHFDGCEGVGCFGGLAVVKAGPTQFHDLNIQIANFTAWGVVWGIGLNYIGGYQVNNVDLASRTASGTQNIGIGTGKSVQVAVYGVTTRGFERPIQFSENEVSGIGNSDFSQNNPRFMLKDHVSINETTPVVYDGTDDGTPVENVTWFAPGGHTDLAEPDLLGPLVIADWTGSNNFTNLAQPLTKVDSVSANGFLPKPWDIAGLIDTNQTQVTGINLRALRSGFGYYIHDGEPHMAFPIYVSDQLTARSIKQTRLVRYTGSTSGYTNLGELNYSATPITANDFTVNVVQGQTVNFNALTLSGATGEAGTTLTLGDPYVTAYVNTGDPLADPTAYEPAHFKPNRGDITIAHDGSISYTALPHDEAPVPDDMQVYIYDGRGRWKTVAITFEITLA